MMGKKGKKRPQATRRREPRKMTFAWKDIAGDGFVNAKNIPWRKVSWFVFVIVPLIVVISTYQWMQSPEHLTISYVEVSGDLKVLDKAQLEPVIEPFTKTNLYLLDAKALEKAIENNTWVNAASMTKIWPDRLSIKIYEQKPVAFWGENKMLAENGEIINAITKDKKNDALPLLYSPREEGREMAASFLKIRRWMKGFPLKIISFKEDTRGSWKVKLENGITLKVGRNEQKKRVRRFLVGYEQSLANVINKIKSVDLRYTNGFAVQWKKGLSAGSVFDGSRKKKG